MAFKTVKNNGNTDDIIYLLCLAVPAAIKQIKESNLLNEIGVCGHFFKDCLKIGYWIRKNVKYKIDTFDDQNIQLPSALLRSGTGDCKSLSLLYLACMVAAGYNGGFRFVSYRPERNFSHVYNFFVNKNKLFTFDACIIDLQEIKKYCKVKDMRVNYLAGVPVMLTAQEYKVKRPMKLISKRNVINFEPETVITNPRPTVEELMSDDRVISGIGRRTRQERKEARQEKREERKAKRAEKFPKLDKFITKAGKTVKTVALSPARGSFLLLVDLNLRGLAKKLDKLRTKSPATYEKFWFKIGGDVDALNKAVNKGLTKKPLFGANIAGYSSICGPGDFIGVVDPASATAAIASAAAIIAAVQKLFKKEGIKGETAEESDLSVEVSEPLATEDNPLVAQDPASEGALMVATSDKQPAVSESTKAGSKGMVPEVSKFAPSPAVIIGGVAILGAAAYFLTRKKRK